MIAEKHHVKALLIWLANEAISAGGDGDAAWYSHFHSIDEICPILEEVNAELKEKIKLNWTIKRSADFINWGENQEWVMIYFNEEQFKSVPDWVQAKIRW